MSLIHNPFISSALMDCVGCEKCRLWGKLQILGLGTALKILFSANGLGDTGPAVSSLALMVGCLDGRLCSSCRASEE
ncbi:hypothetical protein Droror1_Dr00023580 [Drosera rotundifolia]